MILFTLLTVVLFIIGIILLIFGCLGGGIFLVVFGDLAVFVMIVVGIIKKAVGRKLKKLDE